MRQVPLALAPDPQSSFDSFLAGPNEAAVALIRAHIPPAAPLYLWGPAGSGKTHLLRALVRACLDGGARVSWLDPESPGSWTLDPSVALLVFDDVQHLSPARQQEAFALMVEAQSSGAVWACAGHLPPVDLPLRDDLRSRIGWGHIHGLQPLDEARTRAVLRREADRRGVRLSDEVMDYLLSRFTRDLGSLMELLERLDEFSLAHGRAVTLPLLRRMLAEAAGPLEAA